MGFHTSYVQRQAQCGECQPHSPFSSPISDRTDSRPFSKQVRLAGRKVHVCDAAAARTCRASCTPRAGSRTVCVRRCRHLPRPRVIHVSYAFRTGVQILHRRGRPIRPRVVRHKTQFHLSRFGCFSRVLTIERATRIGLLANRPQMFQHHDSTKQIAAKLLVERGSAFLPHIQRNIK